MFDNLGWWEILTLVLIGLFVFGPERLPKLVRDAARMLRQVRRMARNATADLREEIGTDIDIADLNPKVFVRKHLLTEEDERDLRQPFAAAYDDLRGVADDDEPIGDPARKVATNGAVSLNKDGKKAAPERPATRYDVDAT